MTAREIERRAFAGPVELRADGKKKTLVGYAALYDSPSQDLGGFVEVIRAGAFDRAIAEDQDVMARAEHDTRLLLGKRSSGTLRVFADAKGLRYEVDIPDTQAGRDTTTLIERGDISGSSFAFLIPDPKEDVRWGKTADGLALRELLDLDLIDVAPTANPAYLQTSVTARDLEKAKEMTMTKTPATPIPEAIAEQFRADNAHIDEAIKRGLRDKALARVLAARTPEQREQSYEDRMDSIYAGLYALLGSPWMSDEAWWCVEATFDDRVIVERFEGARRLYQYPMTVDGDGVPSFGSPIEVEEQYVPKVDAAAAAERAAIEGQQEIERLRRKLAH